MHNHSAKNLANLNMVQQQVRTSDVTDKKILEAMSSVDRSQFVLPPFKDMAYADALIPIGFGQVTLQPDVIGRLLQGIQLKPKDQVLEIGTGTGYLTAVMGHLTRKIVSVEIIPELSEKASELLNDLELNEIELDIGNGILGDAQYDLQNASRYEHYHAIVLTGSLDILPKELLERVAVGGRLFAFIGKSPAMSATLYTRLEKHQWKEEILFETDIPPLIGIPEPEIFQF